MLWLLYLVHYPRQDFLEKGVSLANDLITRKFALETRKIPPWLKGHLSAYLLEIKFASGTSTVYQNIVDDLKLSFAAVLTAYSCKDSLNCDNDRDQPFIRFCLCLLWASKRGYLDSIQTELFVSATRVVVWKKEFATLSSLFIQRLFFRNYHLVFKEPYRGAMTKKHQDRMSD